MTDPLVRVRRIAVAAAIVLVVFLGGYIALDLLGGEVEIADPGLDAAVRAAIGTRQGPLYQKDLDRIFHLDARGYGVLDLTEITMIPNLITLDLSGTAPVSLAPVARLERLEEVRLRAMGLTSASDKDLYTLADSVTVHRMDLEGNRELRDIDALASFPYLQELSLRNTGIESIDALEQLTGLRRLDLRETDLSGTNLEPLRGMIALEYLNVRETGIRDIAGIERLTALRYLNLHSNSSIATLESIGELRRLTTLILRHVPIEGDIQYLKRLRSLQRLNIRNTGVRELDVVADLLSHGALREELDIRDNPVQGSARRGPWGYDVLVPYWDQIARRYPEELPRNPTGEILINEVMTSNGTILADRTGSFPDWIELYNPGDQPVNLDGIVLSQGDRWAEWSQGWSLPADTDINPGEYRVVFASGPPGDGLSTNDELHAPFTLSSGGVELVLTADHGRTVLDRVEVPPIPRDTSWGRAPSAQDEDDTGMWKVFKEPTPGRPNSAGATYREITFSRTGGFYREPFELELSIHDSEPVSIYYTLDGSRPDPAVVPAGETSGTRPWLYRDHQEEESRRHAATTYRYTGPIPIRSSRDAELTLLPTTVPEAEFWYWQPPADPGLQATVVRAVAWSSAAGNDNAPRSSVYSETYFVDPAIDDRFALGIVTIAADAAHLFDYDRGIYVPGAVYDEHAHDEDLWMRRPANYRERWEVPAYIEFYEPDGYRGFAVDGGIRIHGGWSRSHPLKSLRLYARKDHHRINHFEYSLFPGATTTAASHGTFEPAVTEYKRLMLRSGQSLFRSHLQDAVAHSHVRPYVTVDLLEYRPVVHFINGEYWGLKNLRERFDRFYLSTHYGVAPEDVIIVDGPLAFDFQLDTGKPGENRPFRELLAYVETRDMTDPDHYRHVQHQMDVDSFIDYNIVRIFSGDADGVTKHVAMWRLRDGDSRWRWHTWDFDNAFMFLENDTMTFYGNDRTDEEHLRAYLDEMGEKYREEEIDEELLGDTAALRSAAGIRTRDPQYTSLLAGLLANREFRHRFINRFADLMNTLYRPDIHAAAIRDAADLLEPEMEHHINRWGYPASYSYWLSQVERHVEFAEARPEVQRRHIQEYFHERYGEITGTASVRVVVDGGSVRVNSITLDSDIPGSATAAEPEWTGIYFTGIPVQLEALAREGYRFEGWTIHDQSRSGDPRESSEPLLELDLRRDVTVKARFERS